MKGAQPMESLPEDTKRGMAWDGAPGNLQEWGPRFAVRQFWTRTLLSWVMVGRALELGCGSGDITRILAENATCVVATGISEEAISATRAKVKGYEGKVTTIASDLFHLEFGPEFDTVVACEILEHLSDDKEALSLMGRFLRDKGRLVLSVPANPKRWSRFDEIAGHKRRYTRQELIFKLRSAGFEPLKIINWGFPLPRFIHWLETRTMPSPNVTLSNSKQKVLRKISLLARPALQLYSHAESLFVSSNLGIGFIVLAVKNPSTEMSSSEVNIRRGLNHGFFN